MSNNGIERAFASRCASLLPRGSSVLAAVSGGSDSMALISLLLGMKGRLGIERIGVLHVNHRLRGEESDGDERFVAGFARDAGCPFYLKTLSGIPERRAGMEAWARDERYRFFLSVKEREGYSRIATGHTADDQAETVLLRLWRGTGLRGMRGILPERGDGVVRPMADLRRNDIIAWLGSRSIPFRSDSSNCNRAFLRNRVRHAVLPFIGRADPGAFERLLRIADAARELWTSIEPGIERWIGAYVERIAAGCFLVRKEGFDDLLASEGLRSVFDAFSIPADAPHLDAVPRNASRSSGHFPLGGAWRYYPRRSDIFFCKESPEAPRQFRCELKVPGATECAAEGVRFTVDVQPPPENGLPGDNYTVVLDKAACGDTLTFRSWRPGDVFDPLGCAAEIPVKDFLAKQKYPGIARPRIGVVEGKAGAIVWIPGVRISNRCRVTPETRECLRVSYRTKEKYNRPIVAC